MAPLSVALTSRTLMNFMITFPLENLIGRSVCGLLSHRANDDQPPPPIGLDDVVENTEIPHTEVATDVDPVF